MSNISELVLSTRETFSSRLTAENINFEQEAGFAIQSLSGDYAMGIALKNKQSVIDAVTNVAAIGISLNPAKKQAYLVPRDGKICLDISYIGLMDLAVESGAIKWAQAAVVYEADTFELRGYDEAPLHKFNPFSKDRGSPVGVFVVVKTADNEYLTHSMAIDEVYAIRDRASQSFRSGKASPWKTDEAEMIKKTCVKQAYKYWPKKNPRLEQAIQYLNMESGEGIASLMPTRRPASIENKTAALDQIEREPLIAELEKIAEQQGLVAFRSKWKSLTEGQKQAVGIPDRTRIDKLASASDDVKAHPVVDAEFVKEMEGAEQ